MLYINAAYISIEVRVYDVSNFVLYTGVLPQSYPFADTSRGGVKQQQQQNKTVAHTIISAYGMHVSMYTGVYRVTPTVISWGMLQQQR